MIRLILLNFFIFTAFLVKAQDYFEVLENIGQDMLNSDDENVRARAAEIFVKRIDSLLANDEQFIEADLKNIRSLSTLDAPDNKFRLLTWSSPNEDKSYNYFGRVVFKEGKYIRSLVLNDSGWKYSKPESRKMDEDNWLGAVYYNLIKKKHRRKTYYILLGWNGNNAFSNRKLIDVLVLDKKTDRIYFGAPIFTNKRTEYRQIFEFGEKSTMSLKFNEKEDKIIFDHLYPIQANQKGLFEFYAPDFTYDAFVWKKGKWRLETNIDARNKDLNEGNQRKKPENGLKPSN